MNFLLRIIPAILIIVSQAYIKCSYNKYREFSVKSGKSGYETAREILDSNGLSDVRIVKIGGELTDNFNPKTNTISLSSDIYDDKSIEIINRVISSSNKIWYDLYLTNGTITITQEQYNEIKELIDSNSLAGITSKRISDGYFSLIKSLNGTFTFRYLNLTNESNNNDKKYTIFKHEIIIKPDLSVSSSSEEKYIPLLTQNLSNQSIISVKTDGLQQNLTIGNGLTIENGALKTTIPLLPADASTKTYTLQAVNGALAWTDVIGDINSILDNINGEVI